MKKKPEPFTRAGKSNVTLRNFLNNLKENDLHFENKQITQCVFLGVLKLKPVPTLFSSSNNITLDSSLVVESNPRRFRNNSSHKEVSMKQNINKVISGKIRKKNTDRIKATVKKVPNKKTVIKIKFNMKKSASNESSTDSLKSDLTGEIITLKPVASPPIFNPVENLFNKLKQQMDFKPNQPGPSGELQTNSVCKINANSQHKSPVKMKMPKRAGKKRSLIYERLAMPLLPLVQEDSVVSGSSESSGFKDDAISLSSSNSSSSSAAAEQDIVVSKREVPKTIRTSPRNKVPLTDEVVVTTDDVITVPDNVSSFNASQNCLNNDVIIVDEPNLRKPDQHQEKSSQNLVTSTEKFEDNDEMQECSTTTIANPIERRITSCSSDSTDSEKPLEKPKRRRRLMMPTALPSIFFNTPMLLRSELAQKKQSNSLENKSIPRADSCRLNNQEKTQRSIIKSITQEEKFQSATNENVVFVGDGPSSSSKQQTYKQDKKEETLIYEVVKPASELADNASEVILVDYGPPKVEPLIIKLKLNSQQKKMDISPKASVRSYLEHKSSNADASNSPTDKPKSPRILDNEKNTTPKLFQEHLAQEVVPGTTRSTDKPKSSGKHLGDGKNTPPKLFQEDLAQEVVPETNSSTDKPKSSGKHLGDGKNTPPKLFQEDLAQEVFPETNSSTDKPKSSGKHLGDGKNTPPKLFQEDLAQEVFPGTNSSTDKPKSSGKHLGDGKNTPPKLFQEDLAQEVVPRTNSSTDKPKSPGKSSRMLADGKNTPPKLFQEDLVQEVIPETNSSTDKAKSPGEHSRIVDDGKNTPSKLFIDDLVEISINMDDEDSCSTSKTSKENTHTLHADDSTKKIEMIVEDVTVISAENQFVNNAVPAPIDKENSSSQKDQQHLKLAPETVDLCAQTDADCNNKSKEEAHDQSNIVDKDCSLSKMNSSTTEESRQTCEENITNTISSATDNGKRKNSDNVDRVSEPRRILRSETSQQKSARLSENSFSSSPKAKTVEKVENSSPVAVQIDEKNEEKATEKIPQKFVEDKNKNVIKDSGGSPKLELPKLSGKSTDQIGKTSKASPRASPRSKSGTKISKKQEENLDEISVANNDQKPKKQKKEAREISTRMLRSSMIEPLSSTESPILKCETEKAVAIIHEEPKTTRSKIPLAENISEHFENNVLVPPRILRSKKNANSYPTKPVTTRRKQQKREDKLKTVAHPATKNKGPMKKQSSTRGVSKRSKNIKTPRVLRSSAFKNIKTGVLTSAKCKLAKIEKNKQKLSQPVKPVNQKVLPKNQKKVRNIKNKQKKAVNWKNNKIIENIIEEIKNTIFKDSSEEDFPQVEDEKIISSKESSPKENVVPLVYKRTTKRNLKAGETLQKIEKAKKRRPSLKEIKNIAAKVTRSNYKTRQSYQKKVEDEQEKLSSKAAPKRGRRKQAAKNSKDSKPEEQMITVDQDMEDSLKHPKNELSNSNENPNEQQSEVISNETETYHLVDSFLEEIPIDNESKTAHLKRKNEDLGTTDEIERQYKKKQHHSLAETSSVGGDDLLLQTDVSTTVTERQYTKQHHSLAEVAAAEDVLSLKTAEKNKTLSDASMATNEKQSTVKDSKTVDVSGTLDLLCSHRKSAKTFTILVNLVNNMLKEGTVQKGDGTSLCIKKATAEALYNTTKSTINLIDDDENAQQQSCSMSNKEEKTLKDTKINYNKESVIKSVVDLTNEPTKSDNINRLDSPEISQKKGDITVFDFDESEPEITPMLRHKVSTTSPDKSTNVANENVKWSRIDNNTVKKRSSNSSKTEKESDVIFNASSIDDLVRTSKKKMWSKIENPVRAKTKSTSPKDRPQNSLQKVVQKSQEETEKESDVFFDASPIDDLERTSKRKMWSKIENPVTAKTKSTTSPKDLAPDRPQEVVQEESSPSKSSNTSPMKQPTIIEMFNKVRVKTNKVTTPIEEDSSRVNLDKEINEKDSDYVTPHLKMERNSTYKVEGLEDEDSDCESRAEWVPEEYAEYKMKYSAQKMMQNKQVFKCKVCLQILPSYYKLVKHKKEHESKVNPYVCPQCEADFNNIDDLTAHLRIHKGKHPYMCTKCNIGFATKQAYDDHTPIHILRKLKPPVKKFRCDVCAKEFSKVCDVERHTRVHTGEKPCVCNICNKGFQQSHNLSKHLLTHLHIKPFQCDICNKQFGRADVLARHLLTHSLDKPIKCWVCEKGFIRQSQLTHHMKKYHPNDPFVKPEPQDVEDNAEEVE